MRQGDSPSSAGRNLSEICLHISASRPRKLSANTFPTGCGIRCSAHWASRRRQQPVANSVPDTQPDFARLRRASSRPASPAGQRVPHAKSVSPKRRSREGGPPSRRAYYFERTLIQTSLAFGELRLGRLRRPVSEFLTRSRTTSQFSQPRDAKRTAETAACRPAPFTIRPDRAAVTMAGFVR